MVITNPGYYSNESAASPSLCNIGTFNRLYAQDSCTDCPARFYCNSTGMIEPNICPQGFYCEENSVIYSDCPIGTFSNSVGLANISECLYCTPGMYCAKASLTIPSGLCNPGYYCTFGAISISPVNLNSNTGVFGICPQGYYCPQGSPLPIACPMGTYLNTIAATSVNECIPCTAGSYCTDAALTTVQGSCDLGYYCLIGTSVPRPTSLSTEMNYCSYGQYCPLGSSESNLCPQGTYQDSLRQGSCETCPEGYYCPAGTGDFTLNICPIGNYCPLGSGFAIPCPLGTYSSRLGLINSLECILCPPGYYCSISGKTLITASDECDPGYFCKIGSKMENPQQDYPGDASGGRCIKGYYCPAGSSYALECDGGQYCDLNALSSPSGFCSPGYYCIGRASTSTPTDGVTGNICPAGFFCPSGSISPIGCPIGTYSSSTGRSNATDCISCPAGKYCGGIGLKAYSGSCAPGFYCEGGNYEYMPILGKCPGGSFCPLGSHSPQLCSAGSYQDQTQQSSCKSCPKGYYCENDGAILPSICQSGYYCPINSATMIPCPSGTYSSIPGRTLVNSCINCPPGSYCLGGGNLPDGLCNGGYYCIGGSTSASPLVDAEGGICPKGYICPQGSSSPKSCPSGFYCGIKGLTTYSGPCMAGYYCIGGAYISNPRDGITGNTCPAGYYCPDGSSYPIPCKIGSFQVSQQKTSPSDCLACIEGFYCSSLTATALSGLCSEGYYCPKGSISSTNTSNLCPQGYYCPIESPSPIECQAGTYQDQIGQGSCKYCPAGFYCDLGSSVPVICPIGYMCPIQTSSANLKSCGIGFYNPFQGQSNCQICPEGFFCGIGSIITPIICPAGSYCPSGTFNPIKCFPGTYSNIIGIQISSQCKQCPAGYYCNNGQILGMCNEGYYCISGNNIPNPDSYTNQGVGMPCPAGSYCIMGTLLPTPCPPGRVRVAIGGKSVQDCGFCESGYYCIKNNPIPYQCPAGSYCPKGADTPIMCPIRYYSNVLMASSITACLVCPSGYNCNRPGVANYNNFPCIPGYYCPINSILPVISPSGYYSPWYNSGKISDLLQCPGGYYCDELSTTYTLCNLGTYCPISSSIPLLCPQGYFCDYQTSIPMLCPNGFYCSESLFSSSKENSPLLCPIGTICPTGSISPTYCNAGQYAIMVFDINGANSSCENCPPGYYSLFGSANCSKCDPGYICLGNTIISNPNNIQIEKGYKCSAGYYCPSGAFTPIACPLGTFSNKTGQSSLNDCIQCPAGTYTDTAASIACKTCKGSSYSTEGSDSCTCISKTRVYLESLGICICITGYDYIDYNGNDLKNQDSSDDCSKIIYQRCQNNQVRDVQGTCTSNNECNSDSLGNGFINPSTGICLPQNVQDLNLVCSQACRQSSLILSVTSSNLFLINDPVSGSVDSVSLSSITGLAGNLKCILTSSCKVYSMAFSANFEGIYGVHPDILSLSTSRHRQLSTIPSIINPIICLQQGESLLFTIVPPYHYPIYLSSSLINTNQGFDYSQFLILQNNITSGVDIFLFGFTFTEEGVYLFGDNNDTNIQTIIAVMNSTQQCPFKGANIQPKIASALYLIGAKVTNNILLAVD